MDSAKKVSHILDITYKSIVFENITAGGKDVAKKLL